MRHDEKDMNGRDEALRTREQVIPSRDEGSEANDHVVFDFTGLHRPDVADLALILTARLQAPLHENVWVRAIHPNTARVLAELGLDHLFRSYPDPAQLH